jgi:hypothetical protein
MRLGAPEFYEGKSVFSQAFRFDFAVAHPLALYENRSGWHARAIPLIC